MWNVAINDVKAEKLALAKEDDSKMSPRVNANNMKFLRKPNRKSCQLNLKLFH